ncbi:MAG: phosphatidate cytidylyltransferase [Thermoanaerobaculales bacterium]|jgi:phosphatidate cytidylyltransferase|nr:phosphatidate cytidylyltransferase [Thermoanaerobaculales bacterium]
MGQREAFAAVAIPLLAAAIIWLPSWAFLGLLSVALVLAADELLSMARVSGVPVSRWTALPVLVGVMASSWMWGLSGMAVAAVAAVIALPALQLVHPEAPENGLTGAAVACLTTLYIGLSGACLGWIRVLPDGDLGIRLLFFFLVTIWLGDSGAYYIGSHFGRHKMSPRISPNKTWEGLAGGVAATFAAAAAAKLVFGLPLAWVHMAALAAVLAVAAPLGDLIESQFKRDTGVKDSSNLIPGHGGFLDRTDSLIFAAPPFLGYLVATGLI